MKRNWYVKIAFVKEDCWIGVYWRTKTRHLKELRYPPQTQTTIFICVVPCLPIIIWTGWRPQ